MSMNGFLHKIRTHLWLICLIAALLLYVLGLVLMDDIIRVANLGSTLIAGSLALLAAVVAARSKPEP